VTMNRVAAPSQSCAAQGACGWGPRVTRMWEIHSIVIGLHRMRDPSTAAVARLFLHCLGKLL
jgi:hypothetical protein